jgi:acyl-coenzyme A thioesterase PaaI-like protein
LTERVPLPTGAVEDPDNPGWYTWNFERGTFAAATGKFLLKPDGPGRAVTRIFPTDALLNMGGSIHGGAVMSFIDMSLFAGGRCAGMEEGHYVTLDCSVHFIGRGSAGKPLDAHVRLVKQTRGGHVFFVGTCEQDGEPTHSFTGTLKRVRPPE